MAVQKSGFDPALVKKFIDRLRDKAAKVAKYEQGQNPEVLVGFSAAYALYVHEDIEMAWKGLSRDPRIRRIEQGGDPAKARPRPRRKEPKGRFWDPQDKGQAKFLEGPLRELRDELRRIIATAMQAGKTPAQALLLAGLRLQREAQKRVPVDSGNLKSSAYTRLSFGDAVGANETGEFDTSSVPGV